LLSNNAKLFGNLKFVRIKSQGRLEFLVSVGKEYHVGCFRNSLH